MALEPKGVPAEDADEHAELRDMTRRFWIGAALTLPVFLLTMAEMIFGHDLPAALQGRPASSPPAGHPELVSIEVAPNFSFVSNRHNGGRCLSASSRP